MAGKLGVGRDDLEGLKFGRLTCVDSFSRVMKSSRSQVYWNCICECGNLVAVRPQQLKEGKTVSCGCKKLDNSKEKAENSFCLNVEYTILKDIIRRCDPKEKIERNRNYGARGISVDLQWAIGGREGFNNFITDMGYRPTEKHSIERVDVNLGYCKDNCIWTDNFSLQAFNQRPRKSKFGVPGVSMDKGAYGYVVTIGKDNIRHYIGFFKTLVQAAEARKDAEIEHYGFNLDWEMPT